MLRHRTEVSHGHVQWCMSCNDCAYYAYTPNETDAHRWAEEHRRHPHRDPAGIWAWSRWRSVQGVNHAWPFGTAACGTLRYRQSVNEYGQDVKVAVDPDGLADPSLPVCQKCLAMTPREAERPPT